MIRPPLRPKLPARFASLALVVSRVAPLHFQSPQPHGAEWATFSASRIFSDLPSGVSFVSKLPRECLVSSIPPPYSGAGHPHEDCTLCLLKKLRMRSPFTSLK